MELENIKEYLKINAEDPQVKTFLDSISDKRVNQALSNLNNKIPEMVEAEVIKRQELENNRAAAIEKEKAFNEELENKLSGLNVPLSLGRNMLAGLTSESTEEEINSKLSEIESVKKEMGEKIMKDLSGIKRAEYNSSNTPSMEQQVMKNLGL